MMWDLPSVTLPAPVHQDMRISLRSVDPLGKSFAYSINAVFAEVEVPISSVCIPESFLSVLFERVRKGGEEAPDRAVSPEMCLNPVRQETSLGLPLSFHTRS
jgi:hypothetical protein